MASGGTIGRDELVDLTREFVRTPSVLGDEGAMARAVVEAMRRRGFDRAEIDACGNAVGVIEGASPGPVRLFDAHMDTVDVTPREAWTRDPFGGEVEGGKLYGRGSSDMKGALAGMIAAAGSLDRARLAGRVVISASVGEETIEGAALREVMKAHPPDFVVIGEATELNVARAGRGRAEFIVTARERPSHASTPERGVNAIHEMRRVVERVEAIPMPRNPFVGRGVVALTDIISIPYPAHSVIPSGCRATYERRLLPGETREAVVDDMRRACEEAGAPATGIELARTGYTTWTGVAWDEEKWYPAWELSENHALIEAAMAALRSAGLDPRTRAYQFCTNAAYCAGVAGTPTIGFGPSSEDHAHVVDEYIEIDHLAGAARGYARLMTCAAPGLGADGEP